MINYDVFLFYYQGSFLSNYLDLPILKFFKKKIIFIYCGSDSRPPYLDGCVSPEGEGNCASLIRMTAQWKKRLLKVEKYADYIAVNRSSSHLHEKPALMRLLFGPVRNISSMEPHNNSVSGGSLKILHCPSHPLSKGTAEIRIIVECLKNKGYSLELIEITGQPNEVVLKALAECDLVIDQMYSDVPLTAFLTEAAFFGKPAVVGGYDAKRIKSDLPLELLPPTIFVHPDQMESAVEALVADPEYRRAVGDKSRQYAEAYRRPEMMAEHILRLANDDVPADWFFDPRDTRSLYLHGYGRPESQIKELLRAFITEGGREALQVSDKPELEQALVDFAEVDKYLELRRAL
jgi:glycosyltransferase involved in cell wall biosynthesis